MCFIGMHINVFEDHRGKSALFLLNITEYSSCQYNNVSHCIIIKTRKVNLFK